MSVDVELACRCGSIHGWARAVTPNAVNRVVCYCDDCQAFLHHIGRADLLDPHGGTDVVQLPPNAVAFDRGAEHIVGVRLTSRGMHRWYASCCQTPLGNTLAPLVAFIGMPVEVFCGAPDARRRDELFGDPRGAIHERFATGGPPEGLPRFGSGKLIHMLVRVVGWKLRGKAWPHPFFDRTTGAPSHPVTTLTPAERAALRPKCGPNPTVPGN
ncbi:MAG: hypothetical protein JW751_28205 [Polyangiaceae bacterium]|nr:hypothetical protein [Polyangiaceae bacterium]